MNKVLTVLCGKRAISSTISSLCYRRMSQIQPCFFSSVYSIDFHKQNYQMISPLQTFSCLRHMGFLSRVRTKLYSFVSNTTKVKVSSCLVYEKIADNINYVEFFQYFELPDTFQSWFSSIQLHMYMTILVTVSERNGRLFRTGIVQTMWRDVEIRLDHLTDIKQSTKRKYLKELVNQFNASLIAYDEGVLSDDKVLAASCWRMLFACQPLDPELLEKCVMYIRKQIAHLDSQNTEDIILRGSITFLPLNNIISGDK